MWYSTLDENLANVTCSSIVEIFRHLIILFSIDLYSYLAELIITSQHICVPTRLSRKTPPMQILWVIKEDLICFGLIISNMTIQTVNEDLFSCFSVSSEGIKQLEEQKEVLESESANYASESQKLQQKLQIMTEMYQENELKLHRFKPWIIYIFHSLYFAVSFYWKFKY